MYGAQGKTLRYSYNSNRNAWSWAKLLRSLW